MGSLGCVCDSDFRPGDRSVRHTRIQWLQLFKSSIRYSEINRLLQVALNKSLQRSRRRSENKQPRSMGSSMGHVSVSELGLVLLQGKEEGKKTFEAGADLQRLY